MEIIVGKYSGFCAGVNHTYNEAKKYIEKNKNVYCLGEIIHNDLVIKELEDLGMITVNDIKEIPKKSKVIFRAHGEPLKNYDYAKKNELDVIDLTCGKVKIIHNKVFKEKKGSFIVIIGKKTHPEIIGTIGFSGKYYHVIETKDDIEELKEKFEKSNKKKLYIISQTTFSNLLFDTIVKLIKEKLPNVEIVIDKTICDATKKRQEECFDISKRATLMFVVGGTKSSNTRELYEIASYNCFRTFFIENIDDLDKIMIYKTDIVGVVAGASTPKSLIDEVKKYTEENALDV